MNENCEACALGPTKVDGHAALMVHMLTAAGMLFKCLQCKLTWIRSYSTDGRYDWARPAATACVGVVMPSARSTPAAVAEASSLGGEAMDHWLATRHSWRRTSRRPR